MLFIILIHICNKLICCLLIWCLQLCSLAEPASKRARTFAHSAPRGFDDKSGPPSLPLVSGVEPERSGVEVEHRQRGPESLDDHQNRLLAGGVWLYFVICVLFLLF